MPFNIDRGTSLIGDFCSLVEAKVFADQMRLIDADRSHSRSRHACHKRHRGEVQRNGQKPRRRELRVGTVACGLAGVSRAQSAGWRGSSRTPIIRAPATGRPHYFMGSTEIASASS